MVVHGVVHCLAPPRRRHTHRALSHLQLEQASSPLSSCRSPSSNHYKAPVSFAMAKMLWLAFLPPAHTFGRALSSLRLGLKSSHKDTCSRSTGGPGMYLSFLFWRY